MSRISFLMSWPDCSKSRASQASNSGWLGGYSELISLTGCTKPRPVNIAQTRLTNALASPGLSVNAA